MFLYHKTQDVILCYPFET